MLRIENSSERFKTSRLRCESPGGGPQDPPAGDASSLDRVVSRRPMFHLDVGRWSVLFYLIGQQAFGTETKVTLFRVRVFFFQR